jgi:hypothetical protein
MTNYEWKLTEDIEAAPSFIRFFAAESHCLQANGNVALLPLDFPIWIERLTPPAASV